MQTSNNDLAEKIIDSILSNDPYCQWLGIETLQIEAGYSKIKMKIRPEMLNGLGVVHGGILFSLADSAFGFACNNRNNKSLALETSINFLKPVYSGDELVAETKEFHNGSSTGLYQVSIYNQHHVTVALFKGTCLKQGKR